MDNKTKQPYQNQLSFLNLTSFCPINLQMLWYKELKIKGAIYFGSHFNTDNALNIPDRDEKIELSHLYSLHCSEFCGTSLRSKNPYKMGILWKTAMQNARIRGNCTPHTCMNRRKCTQNTNIQRNAHKINKNVHVNYQTKCKLIHE